MPAPAPASTASFSQLIIRPAVRTRAKFAKLRGKAREMRAAHAFFGKIERFKYLSSLEKGEVKMDKRQRRESESGKLGEETLKAAQEIWLADKGLTSNGAEKMARADLRFCRLAAAASAALTGLMAAGTAMAAGTFVAFMPISMAAATVFLIAFVFPWKAKGSQVEKTLDTIAKANCRAQEGGTAKP